MQKSKVYVKLDDSDRILSVDGGRTESNIQDFWAWVLIDEGYGIKYDFCQNNYLEKPIKDERGIKRYKAYPFVDAPSGEIIARFFKDGVEYVILERTHEEMDADYTPPEEKPTTEQRVDALETTTDDIILMMADLIGGM